MDPGFEWNRSPSAWWILLRPKTKQPLAALIDFAYLHMNPDPDARDFTDGLVSGLYRYATCHPDDRNDVLHEIDLHALRIILTEEAKK